MLAFLALVAIASSARSKCARQSYICSSEGSCELFKTSQSNEDSQQYMSQSTCLIMCGGGSIWPYPTGEIAIKETYSEFDFRNLKVISTLSSRIEFSTMEKNFVDQILAMNPSYNPDKQGKRSLVVNVEVSDPTIEVMTLHIDESYSLSISDKNSISIAKISSTTIFGARHGLETLAQLIAWDDFLLSFVVASSVEILDDKPSFPYRGVMIDISRSFIPVDKLKNAIRALVRNQYCIL